ncbi:MAG TPA: SDR family oxidoreductase [Gemmataceae bacterium]|jgi:NAD(P)-dependent dehydrogenase (short-subunit alcohol dehydrogenase family)|nr:SDR family oxidoreductase [Gemmataceae bacterium]
MGKLDGKTALITGGGSGIGLATAKAFLAEGAAVAITGRSQEKLLSAASELNAGERLIVHAADVTDKSQVAALVDSVTRRFGRIDILVNNAGANVKNRAVKDMDLETWDRQIAANLNSAFYCTFAVLPQMRARQDGVIVNVSSISGKRATPLGGIAYSAAKFGMSALGICLGVEEKDNGIRVTNVYPGEVDTPILANRPVKLTAEHVAKILKPEDVAAAVLFVCSLPPRAHVPELIITPTSQAYI